MDLVTGGTGLTGSHLLFELTKQGQRVRATKRVGSSIDYVRKVFSLYTSSPNLQYDLIDWIEIDVLDYASVLEALQNIETVYHTSAIVSFNSKDSALVEETNVKGTANIVDACLTNNVKTLCHISSVAALGEPKNNGIVDESCLWAKSKGQSAYAKSKFHGEMEVWRGAEQGLRVVIVNPSVILGPGRWNTGSGQLFGRISSGMPFYTEGVTGYVDVRDVAKAMVQLIADSSVVNERFILNSENISYKDTFSLISRSIKRKPPYIKVSPWVFSLLWPFITIIGVFMRKGVALSKENTKAVFSKTYYSSDKIKNRLKFDFIPLADSINFIGSVYSEKRL